MTGAPAPGKRRCAWCGAEFTQEAASTQQYCKAEHRKKARRQRRHRERERSHDEWLDLVDPDGSRRETCKRKAMYGSRADAEQDAKSILAASGRFLRAYECLFCNWWHLENTAWHRI